MGASYLSAMKATEALEAIADTLRIFITARELTDESDASRIRELENDYKRSLANLRNTAIMLHDLMERAWEIDTSTEGD